MDVDGGTILKRYEPWAFTAIVVAQAVMAVAWPYLATWDGPAHVASAVIFAHGAASFGQYFRIDLFPVPNLGGHLIMAPLIALGVPPLLAEKLLFAGVLIGLPFAHRASLLAIRPGALMLTYLVLPFAINWFTYAGFYNFVLGLVVFFLTVRHWVRFGAGRAGQLALWFLAGYLCHIVTLAMTLVFLTVHLVWTRGVTAPPGHSRLTALWADGGRFGLACVPAVALTGLWLTVRYEPDVPLHLPWKALWGNLLTLRWGLVVFREAETLASSLLTVTLAGLAAWAFWQVRSWRRRIPEDAWLVAGGICLLMYLVMPAASSGGSYISQRLSLFPWFALLFWLAQIPMPHRMAEVAGATGIIAAVSLTAIHLPVVIEFNRDLAEFLSAAPLLPPGATLVPLYFIDDREGQGGTAHSARTRPMQEAAGYLMATRRVVDLSHYESDSPHFPTRFRPETNPIRFIGGGRNWIETVPPRVNLLDYETQTSGRIDFVLVWGLAVAPPEIQAHPATEAVKQQLGAGYVQIFTSRRGLLDVYARQHH